MHLHVNLCLDWIVLMVINRYSAFMLDYIKFVAIVFEFVF